MARSIRSGVLKCGTDPPCPNVTSPIGTNISNSALDKLEDTAYYQCVTTRMDAGYFFLYFTGPVLLLSCVLLSFAAWKAVQPNSTSAPGSFPLSTYTDSNSETLRPRPIARRPNKPWAGWDGDPMGKFGVFFGTVAAAILLEGMDVILWLKHGLGWEGAITCSDKNPQYVQNGQYLSTFHCTDQTVGGEHKTDGDYAYLDESITIYLIGSALGVFVLLVFVALLMATCKRPRSPNRSWTSSQGKLS